MTISNCRLKKSMQSRLIEYFVPEATACSAADILRISANSAAFSTVKYVELLPSV
jgi:transposase